MHVNGSIDDLLELAHVVHVVNVQRQSPLIAPKVPPRLMNVAGDEAQCLFDNRMHLIGDH